MYIQNSNSSEHDTLQGIADNVPPALHARRTRLVLARGVE